MRRRAHLALRLLLLALVAVPVLTLVPRHPVNEGKVWTGMMLALFALVVGGALISLSPAAWGRMHRTLLPVLVINAVLSLSPLIASDPLLALGRWGELALWSALIPLAAAVSGRRWLPRLGGAVALAAGLASLPLLISHLDWFGLARLEAGTFGNRNQLGQFLAMALWFAVVPLMRRRGVAWRAGWIALCAVILCALLLTRSKGAWMGAVVAPLILGGAMGLGLLPRWRGELSRRLLAPALLLMGALVVLAALNADSLRREWATISSDSQGIAVRRMLWSGTVEMIGDSPLLGVGIGQWPLTFPPHMDQEHFAFEGTRPREAHSDWLQMIAETGALGALTMLLILVWVGLQCRRALRTPEAAAPTLALLALAVMAMVDFPLQRAVPPILAAILVGSLAGSMTGEGVKTQGVLPLWSRLPLAVALIALLLGVPSLARRHALAHHLGEVRAALEGHGVSSDETLAHIRAAVALGASPLEADRLAATALLLGAPDLAEEIGEAALHRDFTWFDHWLWRAEALRAMGETEQAVVSSQWAVAFANGSGRAWHTLGRSHWANGDLAGAVDALREAHRLMPGSDLALRDLGICLLESRRWDEAAAVIRESLERNSESAPEWRSLGTALLGLGQREAAAEAFSQAVALDSSLVTAWLQWAQVSLGEGESAEAEAILRRGLEAAPDSAPLWELLATSLATQWKLEEAHEALAEALRIDPGYAPAWRGQGFLLSQEGRHREAIESLRRAHQLDPEDDLTRQALERLGVEIPSP
ncbi:tetratricopeptide repeat protein [Candidatus Sumerlaeota bacterium]|nr:tetratricopeptide repeat protein [Candidatus Sumerlaeota bacterium]